MKLIVPDYYEKFACIAGRCRHNCCIGWEIDVDEDTLAYYDTVPGEFGERLRRGISREDAPCFRLGDGERCVFLNERGLCDIILNLGEDALCGICADHPRFRNFFADRTEMGLGLCCEEACRIILGWEPPVTLVEAENDGEDEPDPAEMEFLQERQRAIAVLQDRSVSLDARFARLAEAYGIPEDSRSPAEWAELYRGLERLDPAWDDCLDRLAECGDFADAADADTPWEQLAVYVVYRHAADHSLTEGIAFAIHTVGILRDIHRGGTDELCDLCRMWSGEIEYSDENVERVLDGLFG